MGFVWSILVLLAFVAGHMLCCILLEQVGLREQISWRERIPGFLMACTGTLGAILLVYPVTELWNALGIDGSFRLSFWRYLQPLGIFGLVLQFLFLALLTDFLIYWRHRLEHSLFWRIHAVHHSPRKLHAANDIAHPLQVFYNFFLVTIPLSLVTVDGPAMPAALAGFISMMSVYIHSPVVMHAGPLRRFLVDNRFHRVHHSIEERHFHKNFGICFSIWDHLFGTAYEPGEEWPAVGLSDVAPPQTIADYLLLPFRKGQQDEDEPLPVKVA